MPFQPGQSGNPSGKVASKPYFDALNKAIAQDDGKRLRACAEKLLDLAADGVPWAVQLLADRLDGKPKVQAELSGPDGAPVGVELNPPVMPAITREEWMRIYGPKPIEEPRRARLPAASEQHG
jgi:hypothetical protein